MAYIHWYSLTIFFNLHFTYKMIILLYIQFTCEIVTGFDCFPCIHYFYTTVDRQI